MPLVSCIMPTHSRRRFVPLAIRHFLRQDYEPRELVVVDDGDDAVADLMPADPRIRYVRLDRKYTVGAKRNIACRLAHGDLIVHWDDDDWMADWRLSYQVSQLLASEADACGLDRLLFLDARQDAAWQYVYPRPGKNRSPSWLAGGTLCYRRELWQRNPFAELDVGEDNRFVWSKEARRLLALPDNSFYVAMIHDGNTSPKRTGGSRWQRHPVEPLRKMLGSEWAVYAGEVEEGRERKGERENEERRERQRKSETVELRGSEAGCAMEPPVAASPGIRAWVGLRAATERAGLSLPITVNHSPFTIDHSPPVTVSLPYYDCRRYLLRAVDSILGQTYTNLTLVVVNDGDPKSPWDLLSHIDDPRLVRYDLGVNRGRYFVDAVILAATPDPYLLIQDADDWSEPERVATLLKSCQLDAEGRSVVGAVSACRLWREGSRAGRLLTYPGLRRPLSDRFEFQSDHHGLFSTEALRNVGGNYGGYRIGYDTLLVNLLCMTGEVAYVERPLYNRQVRANSLTTSQATGMRSAKRRQVRAELAEMYAAALKAYRGQRAGANGAAGLPAAIRSITAAHVTERERAEISVHAARLSQLISASRARSHTEAAVSFAAGQPAASVELRIEAQLRQLLYDPRLPWSSWTVTPDMAQHLIAHLCRQHPQRVLEAGSGVSTVLLARYADLTGAEVVTLEHDPRFFRQTAALLDRLGLRRAVDLRLTTLGAVRSDGLGSKRWYRPLPEGQFDFAFIDGPPRQVGREATLFALEGRLHPGGELWLHDGHRLHERECLAAWQRSFSFEATLVDAGKGAWVLRNIAVLEKEGSMAEQRG